MKTAIIIGAGPAGLTAAAELLEKTQIKPIIVEETGSIGGISQTVNYKGNRMDIGGHRFFSKNQEVMNWWQSVMPVGDPEKTDRTMLVRNRVSRIFFLRKFFDYPISVKLATFVNMGLWRTIKAGSGYIWASIFKKKENSLENFYINRFGKPLYSMFFEDYTEKVWGVHPSKLGADWGSQRVKGLSILTILKDVVTKPFRKKDINQQKVETSLIEKFIYPKFGPGQLWETVAKDIQEKGCELNLNSKVVGVEINENQVTSVIVEHNGEREIIACDYVFSSMPIKDLVAAIQDDDKPSKVSEVAAALPYRDFITVGLLVKKLKITNKTKIETFKNRVPDTWIYIQERDVKVGRLQVFNNWSPYMVKDNENTMFIGLEYFCSEGDELWNKSKEEFLQMAIDEMVKIDILNKEDVLDSTQIKIRKAYPAYFGSYYELDVVKDYLDKFDNLYCIGRNGQHRYNNMDHSMLTAMEAVRNIAEGRKDKTNVWSVNTEKDYHESK